MLASTLSPHLALLMICRHAGRNACVLTVASGSAECICAAHRLVSCMLLLCFASMLRGMLGHDQILSATSPAGRSILGVCCAYQQLVWCLWLPTSVCYRLNSACNCMHTTQAAKQFNDIIWLSQPVTQARLL